MKRLLLPLDGTNFAEETLADGALPAFRDEVEVIALHCVDLNRLLAFPPQPVAIHAELIEKHQRRCQRYVDRVAERLQQSGFPAARGLVVVGHPVDAILRAADQENADLIVMTTHGRSGLSRLVLGSVADGVIRRSSRPVLVIPAKERAAGESESVLDSTPL